MKKLSLLTTGFLLVLFAFTGCKKDETDNKELLQGIWLNTYANGIAAETDMKFVLEFTDSKEYYSTGVDFDTLGRKWFDRIAYDYQIDGNRILITGKDAKNNTVSMELEIVSLNSTELVYKVNSFKENGTEYPDPTVYTMRKVTKSLQDQIVGTWYGKATHAGTTDTDYHYWRYLPDNNYEYYYRNSPTENWIKKDDNEGRYYVYDNLLASTWTNNVLLGTIGLYYECWEIEITGDTMTWIGYRNNAAVTSYEMVRVPAPPAI